MKLFTDTCSFLELLPAHLVARIIEMALANDILQVSVSVPLKPEQWPRSRKFSQSRLYNYTDTAVLRVCLTNSKLRRIVNDTPLCVMQVRRLPERLLVVRPIRAIWWWTIGGEKQKIQEMLEWLGAYERRASISVFRLKVAYVYHPSYSDVVVAINKLLPGCRVILECRQN